MDGNFIRDQAVDGEQSIEQYADNIVCGSVEQVAAKMIDNIQRLDPSHFACNFQFGCMPLARARRSLERFTTEVLPMVERELGPLENIGKR
jgi:uncharacterized protein YsxB (DUF464 family)